MAAMRLLLDENVQQSIADFLRSRGHEIHLVREALAPGTSDSDLSRVGDLLGLIVVTWDRDLKRLAKRAPRGERQKYRRLGRISLRCNQARALSRVQQVIESIEFEYEQIQKHSDKRLFVEITETSFTVIR
jgi:predicted nuclease of predicted toxin-antitoxin system